MLPSNNFVASSNRLINRAGVAILYTKYTEGVYDEITHTQGRTSTTASCKGYFANLNSRESQNPLLIGTLKFKILISATDLPFTPALGDKIEQDANAPQAQQSPFLWENGRMLGATVRDMQLTSYANQNIFYTLFCDRG